MAYVSIFWKPELKIFLFSDILFPFMENFDGLYKHFLEIEFWKFPFMEIFDSLCKHFLEAEF